MNAILYMASTGRPWRQLPKEFPAYSAVQGYFYAWSRSGVFASINHALVMEAREKAGREASSTVGVIDSQSVKTTGNGGPRGFDAGKKIKGRKRHIVTDAQGDLVGLVAAASPRISRPPSPAPSPGCWSPIYDPSPDASQEPNPKQIILSQTLSRRTRIACNKSSKDAHTTNSSGACRLKRRNTDLPITIDRAPRNCEPIGNLSMNSRSVSVSSEPYRERSHHNLLMLLSLIDVKALLFMHMRRHNPQ